ncbi:MAG: hypothetical protein IVW51_18040, partial [Thermaceae bacterium]|nr:hypothetical protein [Thermaceae bacterium]
MRRPKYRPDLDLKAEILAESILLGDDNTCQRYKISTRTLYRYRAELPKNVFLAQKVSEKKAALERDWAANIPAAARAAIEFLAQAARLASPHDTAAIHAVAGALKIQAETQATLRGLDVIP